MHLVVTSDKYTKKIKTAFASYVKILFFFSYSNLLNMKSYEISHEFNIFSTL